MFKFITITLFLSGNIFAFVNNPSVHHCAGLKGIKSGEAPCAVFDDRTVVYWNDPQQSFSKEPLESVKLTPLKNPQNYFRFGDFSKEISTLESLASRASRGSIAKIRAIGAYLHHLYGHETMVDVCESVTQNKGLRRMIESYWDGIGKWQG